MADFETELAQLLEANTTFQPGGGDVSPELAQLLEANTTFQPGGGDVSLGDGNFVWDNQTGEMISFAEAVRRDPSAFAEFQQSGSFVPAISGLSGLSGDASTTTATTANPTNLLSMVKDAKDLIGLALAGGSLALGIGSAIAGLTSKTADGGSTIKLPDGRTLTLSPQETQLLDLAVDQARNEAAISTKTTGAMTSALDANPGALPDIYGTSLATAASQIKGTQGMAGAANAALFSNPLPDALKQTPQYDGAQWRISEAMRQGDHPNDMIGWATSQLMLVPGMTQAQATAEATRLVNGTGPAEEIMRTDIANTKTAQAAQGQAATTLGDFLDPTPPPAEQLSTDVGMAADRMTMDRMDPTKPLSPEYEALKPLGGAALNTVGRFITGQTDIPDAYATEDATRKNAYGVVNAGLSGTAGADPWLEERITRARTDLINQIHADLGPGGEYSTPGSKRLEEFELNADQALTQNRREMISLASGVAQPASQFIESVASGRAGAAAPYVLGVPTTLQKARLDDISTYAPIGLSRAAFSEGATQNRFARNAAVAGDIGKGTTNIGNIFGLGQTGAPTPAGGVTAITSQNPGSLALGAFSGVSGVSNFQQGTANQNAIMNALIAAQQRNQLVTGGGQLIGQAVSPFLSQAAKAFFS